MTTLTARQLLRSLGESVSPITPTADKTRELHVCYWLAYSSRPPAAPGDLAMLTVSVEQVSAVGAKLQARWNLRQELGPKLKIEALSKFVERGAVLTHANRNVVAGEASKGLRMIGVVVDMA